MKSILVLLVAGCLRHAIAHAQETPALNTVEVIVQRLYSEELSMFDLRAGGFVTASQERVWKVLTDYNRLPEFVPNLTSCKVVSRNGNEVMIEQTGHSSFLFVERSVHIVVRAVETPMTRIDVSLVSGNMKHYAVRWELTPAAVDGVTGTRLHYAGRIEPDFFVPPLIGSGIVQGDVKKMMQAVVAHILKSPDP